MTINKSRTKEPTPKYEYRVRYQRYEWQQAKSKPFQSLPPAIRLAELLINTQLEQYGSLLFIRIDRREVSDWELGDDLVGKP